MLLSITDAHQGRHSVPKNSPAREAPCWPLVALLHLQWPPPPPSPPVLVHGKGQRASKRVRGAANRPTVPEYHAAMIMGTRTVQSSLDPLPSQSVGKESCQAARASCAAAGEPQNPLPTATGWDARVHACVCVCMVCRCMRTHVCAFML